MLGKKKELVNRAGYFFLIFEAFAKFQDQGFKDWWDRHSCLSRTNDFNPLMTGKNAGPTMNVAIKPFCKKLF